MGLESEGYILVSICEWKEEEAEPGRWRTQSRLSWTLVCWEVCELSFLSYQLHELPVCGQAALLNWGRPWSRWRMSVTILPVAGLASKSYQKWDMDWISGLTTLGGLLIFYRSRLECCKKMIPTFFNKSQWSFLTNTKLEPVDSGVVSTICD